MRVWIMATVLLSAVLAGCAGEPVENNDGDLMGTDPAPGGNETVEVANVTNAPPMAALNVSIDGLMAVFNITVTDADNDTINWTLDANGNGTVDHNGTESALVNVTYAAGGNYTALLSVTDGHNVTNITLLVIAIAPEPLPPGQETTVTWIAGTLAPGCLGDIFGVPFAQELDGIAYQSFAIEPHTIGYDYTATATADPTGGGDAGLAFLDADWGTISSDFVSRSGAGTVPEGAAYGLFWSCYYVQNTGTFISTPPA